MSIYLPLSLSLALTLGACAPSSPDDAPFASDASTQERIALAPAPIEPPGKVGRSARDSRIDRTLNVAAHGMNVDGRGDSDTNERPDAGDALAEPGDAGLSSSERPCLFGPTLAALHTGSDLTVSRTDLTTSSEQLYGLTQREQLIEAVQLSAAEHIETPEQALSHVDESTVQRRWLWDGPGARQFTAYDYQVDGRAYAAIFEQDSTTRVARFEDGKICECSVSPERCVFGGTYHEIREGGSFEITAHSVLTADSAANLSALGREQLLAAAQVARTDVTDLPSAFDAFDQGEVNQVLLRELASGHSFVAYEYGAGDNSYGAVFEAESATPAVRIQDGDLYSCRVFAAVRR